MPKVSIGPLLFELAFLNRIMGQGPVEIQRRLGRERFPRPEGLAEGSPTDSGRLSDHGQLSPRGVIGANHSTAALVFFDLGQSGGGMRTQRGCRTGSLLLDRPGISQRVGLSPAVGQGSKADQPQGLRRAGPANQRSQAHARRAPGKAERRKLTAESSTRSEISSILGYI